MKMSETTQIKSVAIIVLAVLVISLIFSQTANPDFPPLFILKRAQEVVFLKLKSTPSEKVDYMSGLLDVRLKELQNVFNHKNYGYILPAANRYFTLAGQITDLTVANHLTAKVPALKEQFLKHQKILKDLSFAYPKNNPDNVEYKYIDDDINYLNLYLDKLSKIQ